MTFQSIDFEPFNSEYIINKEGVIISLRNGGQTITGCIKKDRRTIKVTRDGKTKSMVVSRILKMVFDFRDDYDLLDVHHKDFNSLNDSLDNLQWLSRTEHQELHNNTGSLKNKTIELYKQGLNQNKICIELNLHRNTVSKYLKEYKEERKILIINDYKNDYRKIDIMKKYNVSRSMLDNLLGMKK